MNGLLSREQAAALAEDAETLALLQERELSADMLGELRSNGFPDSLALQGDGERVQAYRLMTAAVADLPQTFTPEWLDELAADFAAIYLNGSYGASPSESVWLSDDHLICQDAMFELRQIYASKGVAAPDWRLRPDDHLVFQLQFIACCLRQARSIDDWRSLANFLDEHLLRWLPDFAGRVANRCETALYAALALLSATWVDQLREILAYLLGEDRPSREEIKTRLQKKTSCSPEVVSLTFMPGLGPTL